MKSYNKNYLMSFIEFCLKNQGIIIKLLFYNYKLLLKMAESHNIVNNITGILENNLYGDSWLNMAICV